MALRPTSLAFTLLLGALGTLPPLSVDMNLPALPLVQLALGTTPGGAALTVSLFLVGFASAQLVLGPLSDRFGRRPVLLGGLLIYTCGGAVCAFAPSISALLVARLLQGVGAAGGTVMAFAVTRDLFSGADLRKRLSYITMVFSVAPLIAPSLGAIMLHLSGWRSIFAVLTGAGVLLVAAAGFGLHETHPPSNHPAPIGYGYGVVVRNPRALCFAFVNALHFGGTFSYVAASPLLLMDTYGVSATVYGVLFACAALGIMLGSWLNGWLAGRGVPANVPLLSSLLASLISGAALSVAAAGGLPSLFFVMPLPVVHVATRGLVGPNATHGALEPLPNVAGAAAAFVGCLQMLTGAITGGIVAMLYSRLGPLAMFLMMTCFAFLALVAWFAAGLFSEQEIQLPRAAV